MPVLTSVSEVDGSELMGSDASLELEKLSTVVESKFPTVETKLLSERVVERTVSNNELVSVSDDEAEEGSVLIELKLVAVLGVDSVLVRLVMVTYESVFPVLPVDDK